VSVWIQRRLSCNVIIFRSILVPSHDKGAYVFTQNIGFPKILAHFSCPIIFGEEQPAHSGARLIQVFGSKPLKHFLKQTEYVLLGLKF
jgi:hypothetical protein